MPLSYLLRPLCLLLIAYIVILSWLHSRGAFRVEPPTAWKRFLWQDGTEIEGVVVSGFADKRFGERIRVRITDVQGQAAPSAEDMFAYLPRAKQQDKNVRAENEDIRPGRRIALWGRLRRPRWPRNPGEFDELQFCSDRGVAFLLQAKQFMIADARVPWRWLPWAWAEAAHRSIHRMLTQNLRWPEASLWEGILLGYKSSMPRSENQNIQDAGVMHLLVPSGAKMAFVLAVCLWTAMRLGLSPWLRAFLSAIVGGFYALIVGAEPPYMRAYACALVGFAAKPLERDPLGFQAVVLSAWSILLANPRELFSAGFQMTYAAILGVMIAMPRWKPPARLPFIAKTVIRLFMISFVVQLMLWPILGEIFGRVSLAGLAANVILVPASGVYMAVGFAAWLLYGLVSPMHFQSLLVPCLNLMARAFQWVCAAFAALPGAAWSVGPLEWRWVAAFYLAALGLLALPRWRVFWATCIIAGIVAASGLSAEKPAKVEVLFLDKGDQGMILARLPDGRNWLLASTLGPGNMRPSLAALGISRLSGMLIASGPPYRRQAKVARDIRIDEIDIFRPNFDREWGHVHLQASPLRISWGRVSLRLGAEKAVITDGRSQFCILHSSFESFGSALEGKLERRWIERMISTRRDGAVRVKFDETGYSIESQRERYSLDHSVL